MSLEGLHILVVDDDESYRQLLDTFLSTDRITHNYKTKGQKN
jgi:DNA-binding response OmpR family regulator